MLCSAFFVSANADPAHAQAAAGAAFGESIPKPSPENLRPAHGNAGADYLVKTFGISSADAAEQIQLQNEISDLSNKLASEDPDSFGGVWVEHSPTFKIIVAFADAKDRSALRDQVSPGLRRYLIIKNVPKGLKQARTDQEAILAALAPLRLPLQLGFDPRSQKFEIEVSDPARANEIRSAIPAALRGDVLIRKGLPVRNIQSGVQSGDALYGGWDYYDAAGNHNCTFAFVTKSHEAQDAILTASNNHCSVATPYVGETTHWVVLPQAYYSQSNTASGMTYDFRAHVISGLTNGPYVWFVNNRAVRDYPQYVNSVPNVANSGYFTVAGSVRNSTASNYGYYVGMALCKNGSRTGLTCGQVTSTSASGYIGNANGTVSSYSGLVRVGQSAQAVNAFAGDSGGPVFTPPDATSRINAAGIMKAAETINGSICYRGSGYDCGYFFMPIDRINDVYPMSIKTETGTVSP